MALAHDALAVHGGAGWQGAPRPCTGHASPDRIEDALLDQWGAETLEAFVGDVTDAERLRRTTPRQIERVARLRERQHNRHELLEVLADLQGIESNLEYVFRRDVERAHGLPRAKRQQKLSRSRFDMLYEEYGVIAEVDGQRGHWDGRFRDYKRDNEHAGSLLTTFRYGTYDIRGTPCALADQLAGALTLRGWTDLPHVCPHCPTIRGGVDAQSASPCRRAE